MYKQYLKRFALCVLGLALYGFGCVLGVKAGDAGTNAWSTLALGFGGKAGLSYGTATFLISLVIITIDLIGRGKLGFGTFLNLLLIPPFGAMGASVATFASYFAVCLLRLVTGRRLIPFKGEWGRLAVNTLLMGALTAVVTLSEGDILPVLLMYGAAAAWSAVGPNCIQGIAGVALGMALTATELADGALVRNVILFSVLVYELVGPALTKRSLLLAGEIRPEGRTSARTINKEKPPVSIH